MRWTPGGTSQDVEDRRGSGGGFGGFGGRGLGIGGILVLLVLSVVFKTNFFSLLGGGQGTVADTTAAPPAQESAAEHKEVQFISFVLDSVQSFWARALPPLGAEYQHAKLVLFRDATQSACGYAQSATGPFYCPGDHKVYIDLGFYDELARRFGAPGEFAQAYVLAHELGHHVQTLLGIDQKVRRLQQSKPDLANPAQVRLELQADCLAGVWGHETQQMGLLQEGEAQQGIDAAAAVGDDRLQRQSQGYVNPDSFTHGSSADRTKWFLRGFRSGKVSDCDTFAGGQ